MNINLLVIFSVVHFIYLSVLKQRYYLEHYSYGNVVISVSYLLIDVYKSILRKLALKLSKGILEFSYVSVFY